MIERDEDGGIIARAPAKINLSLEVLGRRPNGYHEIRTVMQAVNLCDRLRFRSRPDGRVTLDARGAGLPPAPENLVVRAAHLVRERTGGERGVAIALEKSIPAGAGLGGGSSDCATTLMALNALWGLGLSRQELSGLAAELGSDVPFFLHGGTALCEGRGEKVTVWEDCGPFHYLLVMPRVHVSTADVFAACDNLTNRESGVNIPQLQVALETCDCAQLGASLHNDLEAPACSLYPEVNRVGSTLRPVLRQLHCAGFSLSGSGSCFFGVFPGANEAREAAATLRERWDIPVRPTTNLG